MKTKNWRKALPYWGMGTLFLFGSSVVYAQLTDKKTAFTITTDSFNTTQKLNLSIYNPKLSLTPDALFSSPMGMYIYSNYPTKIVSYQLTIYRASDADNAQPLKTLRVTDTSPYEAIMWTGQLDNGQTLSTYSQYKVILDVQDKNGRRDSVAAVYFDTLGVHNQPQESDFDLYTRDAQAGFRLTPLNDKPYLSERIINGKPVQIVDLAKLARMSDQEQQQFWNKTVMRVPINQDNTLLIKPTDLSQPKIESTVTAPIDAVAIPSSEIILRGQLHKSNEIPGFGINRIAQQDIVASAQDRTIVVQMAGLEGKVDVILNGERLVVDDRGRAIREVVLAPGEYDFNLSWIDEQGARHTQHDTVVVEQENDFFFVGLAEVTWAQNKVSGAGKMILLDADRDHYRGTGSWDGRVQFYLKGNLDEYRITAQLDTTETTLKDAFGRIGDRDPRRFTRELDPNAYYPIFGDDSTLENDVNTQGKFYVKLERGKNYALWGNYNTQMTGTALADFNRSLYGAKLFHESENTTQFGDTRSYVALFGATGDTRGSHNEFSSTGGSLYFLKYQRVTEGTLKLSVELRDTNTGRVKSIQTLTPGIDYEIDNFQGRIILTKPLPITANTGSGGSIISGGGLLNGDNVWLVADYEYYSDGFDMQEQKVFGGRTYGWLNDHIRLGGSYVHEDQASGDAYELRAIDMIIRPMLGTHTHLEYASSDAGSNSIYVSDNGGLGFNKVSLGSKTKGSAWRFDQEIDVNELVEADIPLKFKGYYSVKQAGFASFSTARINDLTEWGSELRYDFSADKKGLLLSYTFEEDKTQHLEKIARIQYFTSLGENLSGAVELQDRRENNYNGLGETLENLAALKVESKLFEGRDTAYIIQQVTLHKHGNVADNNKTTLGYQSQITDNLSLGGEVFTSNRGAGGGVFGNWDINQRASVYTKVINDVDSNAGRGITTTVGTNVKATSQMDLYSERQFENQHTQRTTSDVYGVMFKPTESQYIDISYSTGRVNYRNAKSTSLTGNNDTKRDVYILGYGFKNDEFQIRNKLEYRWERGNLQTIKQWVATNRAKTMVSDNFSWLAQFDIANTKGSSDVVNDFTEAALGFAYRPITINNLNVFGKLTYIRGVDPKDQLVASTSQSGTSYYNSQYDQKSWVFALEGVYEFNQYWQMAFKAAHREGYLRYKNEHDWFSSGASLYAARVNFNYADFEYQVEYRTLRTSLADDQKNGIVTSIYHNFGDNAKIGIGYNFTNYNDDLTRLNYKAKGWFINVVGSF